jgi:hypothetical protein
VDQHIEPLESEASVFSSSPDVLGASLARGGLLCRHGSILDRTGCASNDVDWPPCWPDDRLEPNSNAGDARYADRERRTSCNNGICAGLVRNSSRPKTEENKREIKPEKRNRRKPETKKQEELSTLNSPRKLKAKKTEFQTGGSPGLSFRR